VTSSKRPWRWRQETVRASSVGQEPPKRRWRWPHPRSWCEVYAVIIVLLVGFLAVAYALDWLKQMLGRWP